jgi:hypothetical protein
MSEPNKAQGAAANGRCSSCRSWSREAGAAYGSCSSERFVYMDEVTTLPIDGLGYADYEGYSALFKTGEAFGCIHWAARLPPDPP